MRLRSHTTSHKSFTRRHLRMIFAVALATSPNLALSVEKLPSAPPAPLGHAALNPSELGDAGLLPYPFAAASGCGTAGECATANQHASVKPEVKLQRLVSLLGLQLASQQRPLVGQHGAVPNRALAPATQPGMWQTAVPSQVVPASGTQAVRRESNEPMTLALPAMALPSALPAVSSPAVTLPAVTLPAVTLPAALPIPQPAVPAPVAIDASQAVQDFDELSQSLIDIAIPLDMMPAPPLEQVSEAKAIALNSPSLIPPMVAEGSAAPNIAEASPDRQPELIQPAKSLSLSVRQPSSQSVNLSLSDTPAVASRAAAPTAPALATPAPTSPALIAPAIAKPAVAVAAAPTAAKTYALTDATLSDIPTGNRGVGLHMSSASQQPLKTASTATGKSIQPQYPQRAGAMQVRIEGEPAPLLAGRQAGEASRLSTAAPLPSLELALRSATPARAELYETNNKVKAAFATRTSIVPDRQLERAMNSIGGAGKQARPAMTIGLQQSQTLTAEFVITELSVEHPSICQLMQTGENSVSLVGLRPGSTRIAMVMINDSGERQVEIHEVSVSSEAAPSQSLSDVAAEISLAVGRLVPNCDVEIVAYQDYLLVHGFTHYESDAKKILSLVRKTSLVPVVDQLKSNEQ